VLVAFITILKTMSLERGISWACVRSEKYVRSLARQRAWASLRIVVIHTSGLEATSVHFQML